MKPVLREVTFVSPKQEELILYIVNFLHPGPRSPVATVSARAQVLSPSVCQDTGQQRTHLCPFLKPISEVPVQWPRTVIDSILKLILCFVKKKKDHKTMQ